MIVCWRCGENLKKLTLPFARMDVCPGCNAQVHICRMCTFFDSGVATACREDDAEEVLEKERANFCDYFSPAENAFDERRAMAEKQATAQLDDLFGSADSVNAADTSGDALTRAADELFGNSAKQKK